MRLRDVVDSPCGFRYMLEKLPVSSGYALGYLLDSESLNTVDEVNSAYDDIRRYLPVLEKEHRSDLDSIKHILSGLKDISGTLNRIEALSGVDDIELFEVKHLLHIGISLENILSGCGIEETLLERSGMKEAFSMLDPDGHNIDAFYIYDSYSESLASLRRRIVMEKDPQTLLILKEEEGEEETRIRRELCGRLAGKMLLLRNTLEGAVRADILIAKGEECRNESLCFPIVSEDQFEFRNLFHPYIRSILEKEGKRFTGIDISFGREQVLLIGANMGGKTVVLKMLALAEYLLLFGFCLPAAYAKLPVKKHIFLVSGDAQSLYAGLSSFAAEMKGIDRILKTADSNGGEGILALVDEPARSTNPIEGTALVEALTMVLKRKEVALVLTTHYNIPSHGALKYRVCGIENGVMNYRLCRSFDHEVPHEAIRVAESLNISGEWLDEARKLL